MADRGGRSEGADPRCCSEETERKGPIGDGRSEGTEWKGPIRGSRAEVADLNEAERTFRGSRAEEGRSQRDGEEGANPMWPSRRGPIRGREAKGAHPRGRAEEDPSEELS